MGHSLLSTLEPVNSSPSPPPAPPVSSHPPARLCAWTPRLSPRSPGGSPSWLEPVSGVGLPGPPVPSADLSVGPHRGPSRWIFPLDLSGHVRWICPLDSSADSRQPAERLSHTLSPRFEEAAWTEAAPPTGWGWWGRDLDGFPFKMLGSRANQ